MDPQHHVTAIEHASDSYAEMYLAGRELGQPATREQKAIIENVLATDYDGRALVELIQNAHDAHLRNTTDGAILIRLDLQRGEYGTLTVANGGRPFSEDNLRAICQIALSNKPPDEGIGNKGVGFKSILQLTRSPVIYSTATDTSTTFDGFCFRFARFEDFEEIARRVRAGEPRLAEELRENVSALKLPVPVFDVPASIAALAAGPFVTAVDAELHSATALEQLRRMIDEFTGSNAPPHLFLDRVRTITIEIIERDGVRSDRSLERVVESSIEVGGTTVERLLLNGSTSYVLLHRVVPAASIRQAIAVSRSEGRIGDNYEDWSEDTTVTIALRSDGTSIDGSLYTFLPMADKAPLAAHVNGPFFAHLNRKSMEPSVALNSLLLDELAELAAEVLTADADGAIALHPASLVDLFCWRGDALRKLDAAFTRRGLTIASAAVLPIGDGVGRSSVDTLWAWSPADVTSFNPEAVSAATDVVFLRADLGSARVAALDEVASRVGFRLHPEDEDLADWAGALASANLAAQTAGGGIDVDWWTAFYDDLARVVPDPRGTFEPVAVVLADDSSLIAPGAPGAPQTFFHPRSSETAEVAVALPAQLASQIRFTHHALPRLDGQSRRPGRIWLEHIVKEYLAEPVLELANKALTQSRSEEDRRALLQFALDLWASSTPERPSQALYKQNLLVPARGGWHRAQRCAFTAGWGSDEDADTSLVYEKFLVAATQDVPELAEFEARLLRSPDHDCWGARDPQLWFDFFKAAGVRVGLWPYARKADRVELNGDCVNRRIALPSSIPGVRSDERATWSAAAQVLATGLASFKQSYRADQPLWRLPAQEQYAHLSSTLRRQYAELILRGLPRWSDAHLWVAFTRSSDGARPRWPSLITSFLEQTTWMPQRVAGEPAEVTFVRPRHGWWTADSDGPAFVNAQPRALTKLNLTKTVDRLKAVGARLWDRTDTADARIRLLVDLVAAREVSDFHLREIRNAYEQAWVEALEAGNVSSQRTLLVTRRGEFEVVEVGSSEAVFAVDHAGAEKHRLLEQTPVPILAIRDPSTAVQVGALVNRQAADTVTLASQTEVDVLADGLPAAEIDATPVLEMWPWLVEFVLTLIDLKGAHNHRAGVDRLAAVAEALKKSLVAPTLELRMVIAGHDVDAATQTDPSIAIERDSRTVVLVRAHDDPPALVLLERAAKPLISALGFPELHAEFENAVMRLARHTDGEPSSADLATALRVQITAVERAVGASAALGPAIVYNVAPLVAMFDADLADRLNEQASTFATGDDVVHWLRDREVAGLFDASKLVDLARSDDLPGAIAQLGVPLPEANRALRSLGRAPLHNDEGHARVFRAYRDRMLPMYIDAMRNAFIDDYRSRAPLTRYLELRTEIGALPRLDRWLDEYWDLPEPVIEDRYRQWLGDRQLIAKEEVVLGPLRAVQDQNRRVITGTMSPLPPTVRAWARKHGVAAPPIPDVGTVIAQIEASGRLDFEVFDASEVIIHLRTIGAWPVGMPDSITLAALGLTRADIEDERRITTATADAQRRIEESVRFAGVDYSGDDTDRAALVAAVIDQLSPKLLATGVEPASVTTLPPIRARGGLPGGGTGRGRVSELKTSRIGFVGELMASQWIMAQYGVHPKDSWKSALRVDYLGEPGDDSLGYDFAVSVTDGCILFEVKSTAGDDTQFELGETEVRRAQSLRGDERYQILYLTRVLDPEAAKLRVLPNPFGHGGLRHFSLLGQKLRLGFADDPPRLAND